jgi:DNA-directed RNA polymerase subunit omega
MARITVEDCLQKVNNRFALIHMAAKRVRQLRKGLEPTLPSKNKDVVVALREIAAGSVVKAEPVNSEALLQARADTLARQLLEEAAEEGPAEEEEKESEQ